MDWHVFCILKSISEQNIISMWKVEYKFFPFFVSNFQCWEIKQHYETTKSPGNFLLRGDVCEVFFSLINMQAATNMEKIKYY